jgi:hypothetical protein
VEAGVNCAFRSSEEIWHVRIVSFEDGSIVRLFPNIAGSRSHSLTRIGQFSMSEIALVSSLDFVT